jgi:glucose/arabinose dehydrogenase
MGQRLGLKILVLALWAGTSQAVVAAEEGSLELVADGLDFPGNFVTPQDGSGRVFIVDYYIGKILVLKDGALNPKPFLDLQDVLEAEREITKSNIGLISLAFSPRFPKERLAYVTYTGQGNKLILSRFALSGDGSEAIRSSEETILAIENWGVEHHCGHLEFGPDGFLYVCFGDFSRSDTAQDLSDYNSTILRLDVSKGEVPYAIPPDNPFVGSDGIRPEVWVYGVRNPWRFSFDNVSWDLYVPDPGGKHWEELNVLRKNDASGANLGWPLAQGNECKEECPVEDLHWPIYSYRYGEPGCSIIGGVVYRGEEHNSWNGVYIFSDFCTADIWAINDIHGRPKIRKLVSGGGTGDPRGANAVQGELAGPTAVGVGPNDEILITDGPGGSVYRLRLPSDFEIGWQDASELQLRDILAAERTGSGWVNMYLQAVLNNPRWRWTEPMADLYRFVRGWFR